MSTLIRTTALIATLVLLGGCEPENPRYCPALVKAYQECRADPECWGNRGNWGTATYMSDLMRCQQQVNRNSLGGPS